jgi:regulator of replication initiation timing
VLRNRAAAQKSREVKKQQLEAIESERDMLKQKFESLVEENTKLAASNNHLLAQLKKIQEENARLMLHSNQPPPPVTEEPSSFDTLFMDCYGVDPNTTVTYPDSAHDDDSVLSESPCMTHQPAELVCDLPCLQGTLPMISLPLMTLVMGLVCFILSLISRIGTPLSQLLPSQYWMSFSTATSCARRLKTSPICSDVLARLRAATDGNSQRTTSGVERRSVASLILHSLERSQSCGVTQHSRGVTKYSPDAIEYSRGHSFHWAVGGLCGLG